MKFKANKNGRMIEVIRLENGCVKYRDLKYGAVFSVGRATFEGCDITPAKGRRTKDERLQSI